MSHLKPKFQHRIDLYFICTVTYRLKVVVYSIFGKILLYLFVFCNLSNEVRSRNFYLGAEQVCQVFPKEVSC